MLYMQHMTNKPHTFPGEIDLKQFMVGNVCLASRTRRLSRILTRVYEDALRDYGLTVSQFSLLTVISTNEPVTSAEIGRHLDLEKSTLSRIIGKMIKNDWVREGHGDDGVRGLVMTVHGRNTLRDAIIAWQKVQKRATEKFGEPASKALDEMIIAAQGM
jgi:DNA-binding MarR family transcriptional regulator